LTTDTNSIDPVNTQKRLTEALELLNQLGLPQAQQNVLVKQIIDEFAARFTLGGEIIYIGDFLVY
jgi:BsuBI/PstI restriction endonuclease domain